MNGQMIELIKALGDIGVFVAMFLESSVVPIPSEVIIIGAGAIGIPLLSVVIFGSLGATLGAVVGPAIAYLLLKVIPLRSIFLVALLPSILAFLVITLFVKEVKKILRRYGKKTVKAKKSNLKITERGNVYVSATFNNTLITITNDKGQTISWASAGSAGFKGTRKSTPYAAITAVESVARKAQSLGVTEVEVYIKGPGPGRDAALRAIKAVGLKMSLIADVTPIPHNGPRARKRRRV